MQLDLSLDDWELNDPFVTAQDRLTHIRTLTVNLDDGALQGRGEALGVDYLAETAASMAQQLEAVRGAIEGGCTLESIQSLLTPGGARNALDCALWDLASKRAGKRAWELAGSTGKTVNTVYTLSLDSAGAMAEQARLHSEVPVFKLKLDADQPDVKLRAIRASRPDAGLVIDANGGWSTDLLKFMGPILLECRVAMLEQPLERGHDASLEGLDYPVPLCADESCQAFSELPLAASRYQMINIKLDKCGGLTEGLAMVKWCRERHISLMVGNMLGSSLAMAPGFIIAQACEWIDLDGPLWQRTDRQYPLHYDGVAISAPDSRLWG